MCTAYVNTGWLAHTVVVEKPSPLAQHVCPKMVAQPAYARAWLISASRPDRLLVWPNRWCTCLACCRRTKCRTYNIAFHWQLVTRAWTMSSWRHAIDGRTANKLNIMRVKPIRCVFLTDASQSQWFLSRWPRPQRRCRDIMTKFMDKIYALHTFKCTAMTNNLLHQIHKQSHCVFGYTNNNTTISLNGQVPIGRLADCKGHIGLANNACCISRLSMVFHTNQSLAASRTLYKHSYKRASVMFLFAHHTEFNHNWLLLPLGCNVTANNER